MIGFLARFFFGNYARMAWYALIAAWILWVLWQVHAGIQARQALEAALLKNSELSQSLTLSEQENAQARDRFMRDIDLLTAVLEDERRRGAGESDAIAGIDRAPEADDAPVAPILRDALRALP